MSFVFTPKQLEAQELLAGNASHILLEGGGRSGKTLLHVRNTVMRAMMAPSSRHLIARFRFNHVSASVINDTFPKVMSLCFPQADYHIDKKDWFADLRNGSTVWFAGLDDRERTEKILGLEFATIFKNECSQISWASREMLMTRLAQKVEKVIDGKPAGVLKLRDYDDCNPPNKAHWTYRLYHQKVNPETKVPLSNPQDYVFMRMNPADNSDNISPEYLKVLAGLSPRMRRRFEFGEYADATPNALFDEAWIDRWRLDGGAVPDFVRVVVGVDPSGSGDEDNVDNDEIGISVVALGTDGIGYVLEDCSVKAGPATWGKIATDAFERHSADVIVGEVNYGGDMVRATIQTARKSTPFKKVVATRGKQVRAEPFSSLYEQGKVRHVGLLPKLEDELTAFSTIGYTGQGSPNRADALIWALAEIFPGMVRDRQKPMVWKYEAAPA